MKGSYRVIVQNSFVHYDFEIRRNITIIKGDSATGKTTLVEMIREYYENGESSGVKVFCEKTCAVLSGVDWKTLLNTMKERIIFIDEGNSFVSSIDFAREIQKSDNYYVIVTREGLVNLPYSVEEIYGIRESGKYASLKQTYNELYHIYGKQNPTENTIPSKVILEDSNAGYEFYKGISENKTWSVTSASGKSNIFKEVMKCLSEKTVLVIADGAAFGPEMDRMMKLIQRKKNILMYLPESFEYLILKSGIVDDKEVRTILENPQQYIESQEYFSWERYFTSLLVKKTDASYLKYTKKILNPVYLQENMKTKILQQMDKIILSK
ncbi:MAG: translation initiation factor 2 [Oliverpabstia sp.]|nr:translation initiation factor 2 [Eubacterium sp.]MDY2594887.1 translation initiation factor 2 [Oliverpabstia sp.]